MNILMALASIWVFMRMAPAIELIIKRNEYSLKAGEEMLMALARRDQHTPKKQEKLKKSFVSALNQIEQDLAKGDETFAFKTIKQNYIQAFAGDLTAIESTIMAIERLNKINREAMLKAANQARQYGRAGAWGVVFMATVIFFIGILFIKRLKKKVLKPVEEIYSVLIAFNKGDKMRRCSGADLSNEVKVIYDGINTLLDKSTSNSMYGQNTWDDEF